MEKGQRMQERPLGSLGKPYVRTGAITRYEAIPITQEFPGSQWARRSKRKDFISHNSFHGQWRWCSRGSLVEGGAACTGGDRELWLDEI